MVEILGYAGMICLMLAGIPQALKTLKQGHSNGVDGKYLLLLISGFIFMSTYILLTKPLWPVLINYFVNLVMMGIVAYFKFFPKNK